MFSQETTQRIAQQHIADLHAEAAQARLAKRIRSQRQPRRNLFVAFHTRGTRITARPVCTD